MGVSVFGERAGAGGLGSDFAIDAGGESRGDEAFQFFKLPVAAQFAIARHGPFASTRNGAQVSVGAVP